LSGLLIGGNLLDARDSPNYFSTFYIRRFCRVLPIYFLFLAVVALGYRFVYQPVGAPLDWLFSGRQPWYSYFSFTQYMGLAKFKAPGAPILLITWAFAVEVQFYLVVPAIIRFVRRSALPYVFVAGIVIAPIVRLFIVLRFRENLWATYILLPSRMDSLFVGLLCAYCARQPGVWNWLVTRRNKIWVLFVALLAGIPALATEGIPFTILWMTVGYAWMSATYASGMFLALSGPHSWLSRALRWRWLTGLGTISYFVYLFHYGIYGLFMWRFTGHESVLPNWTNFGITLLALEVVLILGKLSWEYFEKPIVKWGHTWKY
jgi:peptidoglycan/LPS O-acetylase OafA/YrhL